MFAVKKEFEFESTHSLPHSQNLWERQVHGHTFGLTVVLMCEELETAGSATGMIFEEEEISRQVKPILRDYLHHCYLNQTLDLDNPTCELIAQWVFFKLDSLLPCLECIAVSDSPTHRALYFRDKGRDKSVIGNILI